MDKTWMSSKRTRRCWSRTIQRRAVKLWHQRSYRTHISWNGSSTALNVAISSSESYLLWLRWSGSIFRPTIWSSRYSRSSCPRTEGSFWSDVEKAVWQSSLSHSRQVSKLLSSRQSSKIKASLDLLSNLQCRTITLRLKSHKEAKVQTKVNTKLVTQGRFKFPRSPKYLRPPPVMTCRTLVLYRATQQGRELPIRTAIRNWVASRARAQHNNRYRFPTIWTQAVGLTLLFQFLEGTQMHSSIGQTNQTWTFHLGKVSWARSWEARSMLNRRPNSKSTTTITMEACKWAHKVWQSWDLLTRNLQMAPMAQGITPRLRAQMPPSKHSKAFQRHRLARSESTLPFQAPKDRTQQVNNAAKTARRMRT